MGGGADTENGPNGISVVRRVFYIWVGNGNTVWVYQSGSKEKCQWVLARERERERVGSDAGRRGEKTYEGLLVDWGAGREVLAVGDSRGRDALWGGHETVAICCDAESGRKAMRGEKGMLPKDMRQ